MTITEFNRDTIFAAAARHWPEREQGWQARLGDLLDAVRDEIREEVQVEDSPDETIAELLDDLRDAVSDISFAASAVKRLHRRLQARPVAVGGAA